uniref:SET domain-containing protein 4 n=1 Tax=Phallusia mammillata TaxID=59560 RepID=A0A6F9DRC3_9ASCI|nr:SET domain-containing protein 4 [Phallusia mammillata]
MTKRGRTSRKRCRKLKGNSYFVPNQENVLLRWMKKSWNFKCKELCVAEFHSTGRGLLAKRNFKKGDVIISVPKEVLIGVRQVCQNSSIIKFLLAKNPSGLSTISGVEALCIFLIEEVRLQDYARKHNKISIKWSPYISSLPTVFNHPVIWCHSSIILLPESVQKNVTNMQLDVCRQFQEVNKLLAEARNWGLEINLPLKILSSDFTWEEYTWAWCCVNTRCVYSSHDVQKQTFVRPSAADCYYLVPFLDLLNHSPSVQVKTGFNSNNDCFEITSMSNVKKHNQVFINYSAHGNDVLLVEYGFVCPQEPNENDVIRTSLKSISQHLPGGKDKMATLKQMCELTTLCEDLTFQNTGASWSLRAVVMFLALRQNSGTLTEQELKSILHEVLHSNLKSSSFNLHSKNNAQVILGQVCISEMEKVKIMIEKCIHVQQSMCDSSTLSQQVNSALDLWEIYDKMLQTCCNMIHNTDVFLEFFKH